MNWFCFISELIASVNITSNTQFNSTVQIRAIRFWEEGNQCLLVGQVSALKISSTGKQPPTFLNSGESASNPGPGGWGWGKGRRVCYSICHCISSLLTTGNVNLSLHQYVKKS